MPITEVYNIDFMEYMATLPTKFFDLAIVDPPYGINASKKICYHKESLTKYISKDWDKQKPSEDYFKELFRVSKFQIIWGANYFIEYLYSSKCWIAWDKKQPFEMDFAMVELAWTNFDMSSKMFSCSRKYMGNKVSNNPKKAKQYVKLHPTQKPIALYEWILKNFAKPNWKIFDSHLGSGSSRIASYELGFDFFGCEIDKDYFDVMQKRFENYLKQPKLFEKNHAKSEIAESLTLDDSLPYAKLMA